MAQQISDPLAIFDVGLVTRHGFHVRRIDQDDLTLGFQHVENRSPIHPGAFHCCMRDLLARQPGGQRLQVDGHGGERPHLATHFAGSGGEQHTGDNVLLMHIQTGTAGIEHAESDCHGP